MKLGVILGDCLFPDHKALVEAGAERFFMAESVELSTHFKYHKHKILFFLSAMRSHADKVGKKQSLDYYRIDEKGDFFDKLQRCVKEHNVTQIVTYRIDDEFFAKKFEQHCKKHNVDLVQIRNPKFLTSQEEFDEWRKGRKTYFQHDFYRYQRKRLGILMDGSHPHGGTWSYDSKNREPLRGKDTPGLKYHPRTTKHTTELKEIVENIFSDHPGSVENFSWSTTREQALSVMDDFVKHRLTNFGTFQDAVSREDPYTYHSTLAYLLNAGLLTPTELLSKVLSAKIPLNSKEGFVRQIIGWREYVRYVYPEYSKAPNHFKHKRKLTAAWYEGTTGIEPVDDTIHLVNRIGWCHHIPRLMIMSNIMLLCEIHPSEVYKWFMEFFIDSADWVMSANVYGMGQFADGGLITTKPYVSSSKYLLRMSDYKKGEWCQIWDALYWRFLHKHQEEFSKNTRMNLVMKALSRKTSEDIDEAYAIGDAFIKQVTTR